MQRLTKWKYGAAVAALVLGGMVACSEQTRHPVGPSSSPEAGPLFAASTPANGPGQCMVDDVASYTKGGPTNCTANDIEIAIATVGSVNGQTYTGQAVTCTEGDTIFVDMTAQLRATSSSERGDVGVWIATDGGDARTGDCNHYNLVVGTLGTTNTSDSPTPDQCAGMTAPQGDTAITNIALGVIPVVCSDSDEDGFVDVGACVAWGIPGGDEACPGDADGNGTSGQPTDFRASTIPDNAAKCNCTPFQLPIVINEVATIEVKKVCSPTSDGGTFDLNIDAVTEANDAACGGTTGAVEVSAGTNQDPGANHSASESGFTTANYNSSFVCTRNGGALSSGSGTSTGTFEVQPDDVIVCTFTNERKPTLTVNKVCAPTSDAGQFNLRIDGATEEADADCGGTTGPVEVTVGSHTVSETAGTGTNLDNYTRVISGACDASGVVNVAAGQNAVCTITNTRKPTLTVNKVCLPSTDAGQFNLRIDGTIEEADADCGGTTGAVETTIGSHTVSETAGTGTNLDNYTRVISGACNADGVVSLAAGQNAVCTITNTRKPTLTVNKVCVPSTDLGQFNLRIDGVTEEADADCGGTTGPVETTIGSHTVSETAGTGTNLADYGRVISGACNADGVVSLAAGQNAVCTITNTRAATLTVNKVCVPSTDAGQFNLRIDGVTEEADADCGGTTGPVVVTAGSHTVSETAGTGTNLDNYTRVISGACDASGVVSVVAGQNAVCTITNTRKPTLTVNKVCLPSTDPGQFNLLIDAAIEEADADCGGTTGAVEVTIGSHTVSETAGTGTNLDNYTRVISGACNASGVVSVAAGQNAVCTITNTRKPTLTVNKVCVPSTDLGQFNLRIDGVTEEADADCGGTTGAVETTIGSHTVSETAGTGTDHGSYTAVISGACAANGTVTLSAGQNAVCTITNTRKATVTINKTENGVIPLVHAWTFEIRSGATTLDAGTVEATGTAILSTGVVNFACSPQDANCTNVGGVANLLPGSYQLCETGMPAGYQNNLTGFTPAGAQPEGADNSTECVNITLAAGATGVPSGIPDPIDNDQPPGGDARTIGFWKNHSSCSKSNGKQFEKFTENGFATLDSELPQTIGDLVIDTCAEGFAILNKSTFGGKKMASDPLYNMAAQLLAAKLNLSAGAEPACGIVATIAAADALLIEYGFDGTGSYKTAVTNGGDAALANELAGKLDDYNNNDCT